MSGEASPDLELLVRQQKQILTELGSLRDDMAVLTAIAMRQDGTSGALLTEARSMQSPLQTESLNWSRMTKGRTGLSEQGYPNDSANVQSSP